MLSLVSALQGMVAGGVGGGTFAMPSNAVRRQAHGAKAVESHQSAHCVDAGAHHEHPPADYDQGISSAGSHQGRTACACTRDRWRHGAVALPADGALMQSPISSLHHVAVGPQTNGPMKHSAGNAAAISRAHVSQVHHQRVIRLPPHTGYRRPRALVDNPQKHDAQAGAQVWQWLRKFSLTACIWAETQTRALPL